MDFRAIARALRDPENQPHQWDDSDLAAFFVFAADQIDQIQKIALKDGQRIYDLTKTLQQAQVVFDLLRPENASQTTDAELASLLNATEDAISFALQQKRGE